MSGAIRRMYLSLFELENLKKNSRINTFKYLILLVFNLACLLDFGNNFNYVSLIVYVDSFLSNGCYERLRNTAYSRLFSKITLFVCFYAIFKNKFSYIKMSCE